LFRFLFVLYLSFKSRSIERVEEIGQDERGELICGNESAAFQVCMAYSDMSLFTLTTISEQSSNYDSKPGAQAIAKLVSDALHERKDWIAAGGIRWAKPDDLKYGRECKLLDYACGTGSITRALGPWVTTIRGIDISENMVQKYNDDAKSAGLPPERVNAVVGDLCADEVPDHLKTPEFHDFDIAVISLGFHHFENPMRAIERLTERLKTATGTLIIVDFLPFDDEASGGDDPWQGTIKNRGFTSTNTEKLFTAAGLEKFSFSLLDEPAVLEKESGPVKRGVFIARGVKKPTTWQKISNWVYDIQVAAGQQTNFAPQNKVPNQLGFFGESTTGKKMFE
jgi:SAM-dependent methyltransferase